MHFRIADTFQASLAKLTNQEQKAAKITVFDLQADPASPGLSFHKLNQSKDPNFWSVRVNRDIRLIVHRTTQSMLIAYVDQHDDAYAWAERRRIEVHPRTGAAQLVEVRETVEDVVVQQAVDEAPFAATEPPLFDRSPPDDALLGYGIPEDWLPDVRRVTESGLFDLLEHLPQEASEALLELATGGTPVVPAATAPADPFQHPDALRRFRVMENVEELELALDYPWEKWTVFLHPSQREYVERDYSGPARIGGTAGTGKTVVALHRVVWLARCNPASRLLLTTFSQELADNLKIKLARLEADHSVLKRIDVKPLTTVATDLYASDGVELLSDDQLLAAISSIDVGADHSFPIEFIAEEWREVVDAWGVTTWDEYGKVPRLGRKTRMGLKQREVLWSIFERLAANLDEHGLWSERMIQEQVAQLIQDDHPPYDFVVVDEAQDIGVSQLRFVKELVGRRPDRLFFAGDIGQRIFQTPFSWKSLGVDIRGRSFTLKVNYRTSHQIRKQADRLLPSSTRDVDGIENDRRGVVSVFEGHRPLTLVADTTAEEIKAVSAWISDMFSSGLDSSEIGVFVRSENVLERAEAAVSRAVNSGPTTPVIATMHLAKGLEFRAVAVMACDDEVIPDQDRIEAVTDEADLLEVYDTERHLLYVAMTRARDFLMLSGVSPASEFLDDLET